MRQRLTQIVVAWCGPLVALVSGCAATGDCWIERRTEERAHLASWLGWPEEEAGLSEVTLAVAEPRGLDPQSATERAELLGVLEDEARSRDAAPLEFALSELAAEEADALAGRDPQAALGYYAESLVHGYRALSAHPNDRVPGTTARYNASLKALLRIAKAEGVMRPGSVASLPLQRSACSIAIELHSHRWTEADFQGFEFADDYRVTSLRNHYHTSGVGVPLIGIRFHQDREHPTDRHYPRKLCYPLTAVARLDPSPHGPQPLASQPIASGEQASPKAPMRLVIELHDPMEHESVRLAGRETPLETDLTTPLAYFLDQPELQEDTVSTLGFLQPGRVEQFEGLYLLEPYDPNRIPVVMVHGLWSSPATWMEMFNDLRSDPLIRSRYQFWFYLYPTAPPFWVSAAQMRRDLIALRSTFDPGRSSRALDQTVLVGHSMGGLLSRLQTVDSGEEFWRLVSDRRFEELDADPEVRQHISDIFFFRPNTSVQRVVTIGTPHRGSRFANGFTQWLGRKLIAFPMQTMAKRQELFRRNPGFFRGEAAAEVMTSIDALSPSSPLLAQLLRAQAGPWVRYHNIVGDDQRSPWTRLLNGRGDGIVSVNSASLDDLPQLASQIVVPSGHVALHRHPQSIAEVRRVLEDHLSVLTPIGPPRTSTATLPAARKATIGTIRLASGPESIAIAP